MTRERIDYGPTSLERVYFVREPNGLPSTRLRTPDDAAAFFRPILDHETVEVFVVAILDTNRNRAAGKPDHHRPE